jgi:hypothetical protein
MADCAAASPPFSTETRANAYPFLPACSVSAALPKLAGDTRTVLAEGRALFCGANRRLGAVEFEEGVVPGEDNSRQQVFLP